MDYPQALNYLLSLVDNERGAIANQRGSRQKVIYDLRRMEALLDALGRPHLETPAIHVAGTKGKGSVAALCDAALYAAGHRAGFYSSPHLHSFCERIRWNTAPLSKADFANLTAQLQPVESVISEQSGLGPVSLFEFMTAMAFQFYAQRRADFQVIEVGLGGRLDATNVVRPSVCAITPVSFDHMAILGDTLPQIAAEKAGIIKQGVPVVVAPQRPEAMEVIRRVAQERRAPLIEVGSAVTWEAGASDLSGQDCVVNGRLGRYYLRVPLLGSHQLKNVATAVAALEVLRERGVAIPAQAMQEGFARVSWPCRLEVLARDPLVVADGAHNDDAVAAVLESLPRYFQYDRLLLVAGFSRDKSVAKMVSQLAEANPLVFVTRSRHPRSLKPETLAAEFRQAGIEPAAVTSHVDQAVAQALAAARPGDLVLGLGSLFVAAEVREKLLGIEPELYPDLLPPDLRGQTARV